MKLKPQDILVLVKILLIQDNKWSISTIAESVEISKSETHAAIKRCGGANLFDSLSKRPRKAAMEEFLLHGLKYAFPAKIGSVDRGIPTAHSASPMSGYIQSKETYVWPYEEGRKRGLSIEPLYSSVPAAVLKDKKLYEFLSLIECIRIGRAREVEIASKEISKRIKKAGS